MIEQKQGNLNEITSQIKYVSHEIRNHLSICDMYSQIIKKNLEKEGYSNLSVENALNCIQKSIQIIGTNLIELKSIDNNQAKIYDFKNTALKGVELSKAYIEDKGIDFEVFIKNSANICVDENKYISCIVNIIKNGIEAIEIAGKITVLGEVKDDFAIIKISNDGKCIPKEKQSEIFNIGYTDKKGGSGFGLGICKKYLNQNNGDIYLNKSTRSETQFELRVPIC